MMLRMLKGLGSIHCGYCDSTHFLNRKPSLQGLYYNTTELWTGLRTIQEATLPSPGGLAWEHYYYYYRYYFQLVMRKETLHLLMLWNAQPAPFLFHFHNRPCPGF